MTAGHNRKRLCRLLFAGASTRRNADRSYPDRSTVPHRLWPTALLLTAVTGCATVVSGQPEPDAFVAQEYAACNQATDQAAGAIRAFLANSDTARFAEAADPDVAPITAMRTSCTDRVAAMNDLIVKVSDGFTPTTMVGQTQYQQILTVMCHADGLSVEDMGSRAQATCAGR